MADGAGFKIGPDNTLTYEHSSTSLKSSENINIADGKVYQVDGTEVLSATELSSNISVDLASLDIDGGTGIASDLSDTDLIIVDVGGVGTNRKANILGISTYVFSKVSGDISIGATGIASIQANSVALGTDTYGHYVKSVGTGTYLTGSGNSEGAVVTIGVSATSTNTNNFIVARDATGNFAASTITADLTGTATTATNLANAANISDGIIDTARLSGSYDISITGNANSATSATSAASATSADSATNADYAGYSVNAGLATHATNVSGGSTGQLLYQYSSGITTFLGTGSLGEVLISGGSNSAPTWEPTAPADAITGLTVYDEGSVVGSANSISALNFIGAQVVATEGSAGVATITVNNQTYVQSSGVSTYASSSGIATVAGIATYTSEWTLGANGTSDYTFTGPGLTGAENDPVIYLVRGQQYKFTNPMGAFPFQIQSVAGLSGVANTYSDGVVGNGVTDGTLTWDVQFDAPDVLYYQAKDQANMGGIFRVSGNQNIVVIDETNNLGSFRDLKFVGNVVTATGSGNTATINITTPTQAYAQNAGLATDVSGGSAGQILYQDGVDSTSFVTTGGATVGSVLLWNGSDPYWGSVSAAAGASGITVTDEGTTVGTGGSITTLNFVGAGVTVLPTSSGIATVQITATTPDVNYAPNSGFSTVAGIATYTSEWTLGANGTSDYTFTGPGYTGAENDPEIYLVKGQQYKFTNTMGVHPFQIQTVAGAAGIANTYSDGIVGNGVTDGTLTWDVQFDAPDVLYYNCKTHGNMGGTVYTIGQSALSSNYAANAGLATDLNKNANKQLLYQFDNDTTSVLTAGTAGYLLQSGGAAVTPSWKNPAELSVSSAGYATSAGIATYAGTAGIATYAGTAGLATDLAINAANRLLYQAANNNTEVLGTGNDGEILKSGGANATPSWTTQSSLSVGFAATAGLATTASNLSRSVVAGAGLSGGGQLTTDRTFNINVAEGITISTLSIVDIQVGTIGVTTDIITGINTDNITNTLVVENQYVPSGTTVVSIGNSQVGLSTTTTNTGIATVTFEFGNVANDVSLKNGYYLNDNKVLKWDDSNGQLTNSAITSIGTSIGINTDTPSVALDVYGTLNVSGNINASGATISGGTFTGIASTAIYLQNASGIVTGTISTERLSGDYNINITGLAGSATTASNLTRSVVAGSGLTDGGQLISDVTLNVGAGTGITVNTNDIALKNASNLTDDRILKWTSSDQLESSIITENSSNIGIGSAQPTQKLDVAGNIKVNGDGTDAYLYGPSNLIIDPSPVGFNTFAADVSAQGTIGITTDIITGINTTGISTELVVKNQHVPSGTTVVSIGNSQVGLSANTTNTQVETDTFEFGTIRSGIVRIKGDLYVDGTTTQINTTELTIKDHIIGIASTATTNVLADGAGIGVGSDKFFTYDNTNTAFKSTENLNLEDGKSYKIDGTDVLTSSTLGTNVLNSSLTSVGTISTGTWQGSAIGNSYISTISTANKVSLSALDIDGATQTTQIADNDLLIVDDGANGTNRKVEVSVLKSHVTPSTVTNAWAVDIDTDSANIDRQIVFVSSGSYGFSELKIDSETSQLKYNPGTNTLTVSNIAGTASSASYAATAGYAPSAGIATYAGTAGVSTYAGTAGIATYATDAGISTAVKITAASGTSLRYIHLGDQTTGNDGVDVDTLLNYDRTTNSLGIGTVSPREELDVVGDIGVQASGSSNRFSIQHNSAQNSLDFVFI